MTILVILLNVLGLGPVLAVPHDVFHQLFRPGDGGHMSDRHCAEPPHRIFLQRLRFYTDTHRGYTVDHNLACKDVTTPALLGRVLPGPIRYGELDGIVVALGVGVTVFCGRTAQDEKIIVDRRLVGRYPKCRYVLYCL